jgi:hypothetical protein
MAADPESSGLRFIWAIPLIIVRRLAGGAVFVPLAQNATQQLRLVLPSAIGSRS